MSDNNQLLTSDFIPDSNIIEQETDRYVLLIGSLITILQNKRVNHTNLIIYILDNKEIHDLLINIIGVDSLQQLLQIIFRRYPQLNSSKTISRHINKQITNNK